MDEDQTNSGLFLVVPSAMVENDEIDQVTGFPFEDSDSQRDKVVKDTNPHVTGLQEL